MYNQTNQNIKIIFTSFIACFVMFFPVDCIYGGCKGNWKSQFGKVTDKEIKTTHHEDSNGNRYTDTDYIIHFNVKGYTNETSVSRSNYHSIVIGDQIQVEQRIGGFTGWIYNYGFKNKVTGLPSEK